MSGRVRFSIHVDSDIHDKIRMTADLEGTSLNSVVNDIIETWFYDDSDIPVTTSQKLDHLIKRVREKSERKR